jgi:hypothetical protein
VLQSHPFRQRYPIAEPPFFRNAAHLARKHTRTDKMDKENQNGRKVVPKVVATIKANARKFAKAIGGFRKESGNSGEGTDSQPVARTEGPLSPPIDSDIASPSSLQALGPVTPSISNEEHVGEDLPEQEQVIDTEVDAKRSEEIEASSQPLNAVQIVNEKSILDARVDKPGSEDLKQLHDQSETNPADSCLADPEIVTLTKMDSHLMSTIISQKETEATRGTISYCRRGTHLHRRFYLDLRGRSYHLAC